MPTNAKAGAVAVHNRYMIWYFPDRDTRDPRSESMYAIFFGQPSAKSNSSQETRTQTNRANGLIRSRKHCGLEGS